MTSAPPLLSICVPTFNRRQLLERNVTFHLDRFGELGIPFEIVIADDCSTDGTADYLASLAADPRVRPIRRARNSGFLDNYAFVMRQARGRFALFLGDDDLLIPEKVLDYIERMVQDPAIGMVQAPWLLMDERPGGGPMGPFYRIPEPTRFEAGDLPRLMGFIFRYHVFPEFMIIRRDVLAKSISSACPFIFWAFLYTARAAVHADCLFMPEPFARVTAISADPRLQQGNNEAMFQWDRYRGGIEYLVSLARQAAGDNLASQAVLEDSIAAFMRVRMEVALRLNRGAKNWAEAYVLHHRMAAHGKPPLDRDALAKVRIAAGLATATAEAVSYAAGPAVVDPRISDQLLEALKPEMREKLTRALPPPAMPGPHAFLSLDATFPEHRGPADAVFDVNEYISQFI